MNRELKPKRKDLCLTFLEKKDGRILIVMRVRNLYRYTNKIEFELVLNEDTQEGDAFY